MGVQGQNHKFVYAIEPHLLKNIIGERMPISHRKVTRHGDLHGISSSRARVSYLKHRQSLQLSLKCSTLIRCEMINRRIWLLPL